MMFEGVSPNKGMLPIAMISLSQWIEVLPSLALDRIRGHSGKLPVSGRSEALWKSSELIYFLDGLPHSMVNGWSRNY